MSRKKPDPSCRSCCWRANLWMKTPNWAVVRCVALPQEVKRDGSEACSLYKYNGVGDCPDTPNRDAL